MIIMGIDPGTATTGYGIVNIADPLKLKCLDYGQIKTSQDDLMPDRLLKIFNSVVHLIEKFSPDALVIEKIFFNTNAKTALSVGQARGISLLAGAKYKLPVFEYTALQAKMLITGYGRAEKKEVAVQVARILRIKTAIKPVDASDALAIAICHSIKSVSSVAEISQKTKKK